MSRYIEILLSIYTIWYALPVQYLVPLLLNNRSFNYTGSNIKMFNRKIISATAQMNIKLALPKILMLHQN